MKRSAVITILLILAILTSCADKTGNAASSASSVTTIPPQSSGQEKNQAQRDGQSQTQQTQPDKADSAEPAILQNEDIVKLADAFELPVKTAGSVKRETDGQGLPVDLLNDLKLAVFQGTSDELLEQWDDESLRISIDDFMFRPVGGDMEYWETALEEAIAGGGSAVSPYRFDIDDDGEDEIIVIDCRDDEDYYINHMYTLEESDGAYQLLYCEYLGYQRRFAVFERQGVFYLAANFDDPKSKTTAAVGLFSMKGSSTAKPLEQRNTYVKKIHHSVSSHLLYKNETAQLASAVSAYADEIKTDLLYVEGGGTTFYGDETEVDSLSYDEKDSSGQRISNLFAVDADNDGKEEYFSRKYNRRSERPQTDVIWYDLENHVETPEAIDSWKPDSYILKERWFKKIQEKTVTFSLYCGLSEEKYVLDARLQEDDSVEILLELALWREEDVVLSDSRYNGDSKWLNIAYSDPGMETAVPESIGYDMERFGAEVQGAFVPVDHEDASVPNGLITAMEDALFHKTLSETDMGASSFETDKAAYFDKYLKNMEYADKDYFDRYVQHVYQYSLDGSRYFLEVMDSGGSARFVDITIYKEEDGALTAVDSLMSLDMDAKVIEYGGKLFFIEKSYNYYSKFVDSVSIYPLVSDKLKNYVTIALAPVTYEWRTFYQNPNNAYENAVSDYLSGIREDLMKKSPISDDIEIYIGDESERFDHDRYLRLKSIGGRSTYYEIDFDNDGEMEYFSKHFWFPSNSTHLYLITNFYKFSDQRLNEISCGLDNNAGTLVQQWFHEIDGKVFTFKLYLGPGYLYFLNVSLIEGNEVTQVRTDIIAPKSEFRINSRVLEQ